MAAHNIRVLIVDDSAVIRELICDFIEETDGIEVAGTACDGMEALEKLETLRPDVVTLDIQMPRMDGLETLDGILARRPTPVIMVSALAQRAADVTLEALERGALDYVAKPQSLSGCERVLREELLRKVRAMADIDVGRVLRARKARQPRLAARSQPAIASPQPGVDASEKLEGGCVAIGISTGGPPALTSIFEALTPPMPPIVVVQHMPAQFTGSFAERLDGISKLAVKEAAAGDVLKPNHAWIAPGGKHLYLRKFGGNVKVNIRDGAPVSSHKPSADVMMKCAAEIFGDRCLGVIMTGMGRDGADGCAMVRAQGGYVLGQDEATSDVYGMNKAAFTEGSVHRQFALDDAARILTMQARRVCADKPLANA